MATNVETTGRDAVQVQDAAQIQMMGCRCCALPARGCPTSGSAAFPGPRDRFRLSELSGLDTRHPHRGFDNLWYILEGSASTGHSTGRAAPSSGRDCPRARSWRSGRGGAPGMPRDRRRGA